MTSLFYHYSRESDTDIEVLKDGDDYVIEMVNNDYDHKSTIRIILSAAQIEELKKCIN